MQAEHAPGYYYGRWLSAPPPGEEVVITGISGQFPASRTVKHLRDGLFNKKCLITDVDKRWSVNHKEIPPQGGLIPDIASFDPGFFGLHYRQALNMEPTMRGILEASVGAVLDAGVHPDELQGSRTGVYIAMAWSDLERPNLSKIEQPQQFGITGYTRSCMAHRISYFFKLKGPSVIVDTACSSSLNAMEVAFRAIRNGQCDNAIVGGTNLTLHPNGTLQFARLGVLGKQARCRTFDEDANGYVRSETIACVFLQKAKNSRRIYAQIIHAKVNEDGFKEEGIHFPSRQMQATLIREVLTESGVPISKLSYLELHGTGTKAGDTQEVFAWDDAIGHHRREKPFLIGSVKPNVGHAEPASGLASVAKAVIAMEENLIPPNILLRKIKSGITPLEEGKFKVVTEPTPIDQEDAVIGIDNFGFGGNNCHILLRRISQKKSPQKEENVPWLVCVSGRTEEAVKVILDDVGSKVDCDHVALLHHLFKKNFTNHLFRGYCIFTKNKVTHTCIKSYQHRPTPFYINFGKLDSYETLAGYFLHFPAFRNTIHQINNIISDKNLNLFDMLKNNKNCQLIQVSVLVGIIQTIKDLELDPEVTWDDASGKLICHYYEGNLDLKEVIQTVLSQNNVATILKNPKVVRHDKSVSEITTQVNGHTLPPNRILLDISDSNKALLKDPSTFLSFLGRLYQEGHLPQIHKLYPEVKFPVARNTPMISPSIKWHHCKKWYDTIFSTCYVKTETGYDWFVDDHEYVKGHIIDGRNLFPATGYLNVVWKFIADKRSLNPKDLPIVFENCKFVRAITVPQSGYIRFKISIQKNSGLFEIRENDNVVVTGRVVTPDSVNSYPTDLPKVELDDDPRKTLDEHDIYKELYLRGYNYSGLFKGIRKCNIDATSGMVKWEGNWVTFMDKMLQMKILQIDSRLLYVPVTIKRLSIDPVKHLEVIEEMKGEETVLPVYAYKESNVIKCGGIEISGLQASSISKRKTTIEPVLEKNIFVPNEAPMDLLTSLRINTQIILEETLENKVKALELIDEHSTDPTPLMPLIFTVLEDVPLVSPDLTISTKEPLDPIPGVKIESVVLSPSNDYLLVVATKVLERPTLLNQILTSLNPKGYILSREGNSKVDTNLDKVTIVTQYSTETEKLVLLKKTEPKSVKTVLEVTSQHFDWIPKLQEALKHKNDIVLYGQCKDEGTLGFVNCIRREPGGQKIRCFFIMDAAPKFDIKNTFYTQQLNKNIVFNVWKGSQWGTYRHLRLEDNVDYLREHSFVSVTSRGDLSSLRWVEGPLTSDSTTKNLVYTYYCALNFRDIMTASGRITLTTERINQESIEGFEFSGKDKSGNNVMGMINNGALSTLVASDGNLTWPVPSNWTLKEAATVPVVYGTVIYGLLMRVNLKSGTSILIHSGTGGVGLAAINVALYHKCNVFVTVGTKEKREYLKKHFPLIPESHIGNSRDVSFKEMIKRETGGRGVDIVLNSLAEEKLKASIQCLARKGKFLEIGKFDLLNDNSLGLLLLEKEASYHGIMLDQLFKEPPEVKALLYHKVSEGIKAGYVKPLPTTIFQHQEIETAFRYMTGGKHIGKVLIQIRDENQKVVPKFRCLPKFFADPTKCYIILGGLGGFGLELADWLVLRGAKNLVLTSRFGIQTGYQTQRIKIWESYGVSIRISTITIKSQKDCIDLVKDATKMGPIDGIFNLAVVLEDALFEDQTCDKFTTSLTPKAYATKYLDEVSRDLCPNLRYFVVFSSVSCGRGNTGQTNYGMANSIMERICEKRKVEGLPALAIQWGAIGDVGLVAKMQKDNKELVIGGTLQQKISSCLNVLDQFLKQDHPIVSSMVVAEKRNKKLNSGGIVEAVAAILGFKDIKAVSQQATLSELGMDSMMGNEIMQVLEKDFEIYVTPKDLRNMTITKLMEAEAEKKESSEESKMIRGTNTLIQYIPDSNTDNQPMVRLQSDSDGGGTTVFVFPGIEGVIKLVEPLTKNLKANVLGLQYSYKNPGGTVREIALQFLPLIEKESFGTKKFLFIGYSFGAIVALEVASLLEEKNYSGKVISIDGSPEYINSACLGFITGETETEMESTFLYKMLALVLPVDQISRYKDELQKCTTFDTRIDTALSFVPSDIPDVQKFEKQTIVNFFTRCRATMDYRYGSKKLKSMVTLYKAEVPLTPNAREDYGLQELCEGKVKVVNVKGDHYTMLEQKELIDEVNTILKC